MQGITRQLWNCAITVYHQSDDQQAMYEAWCWMKDHGHAWAPDDQSGYAAMLLAVTSLHSQPSQGQCWFHPLLHVYLQPV